MAPGHDPQDRRGVPGKLADREDIRTIAIAAHLGVADGLTLIQSEDSDLVLAAQALTRAALKFKAEQDDQLALLIRNRIVELF